MSNSLFKLDITEDYNNIPLLCKKNEYLTKAFVDSGFRNTELKALNFIRKFIQAVTLADISTVDQAVTLADIATVDGIRFSFQAYAEVESNGLCKSLL